MFLEVCLMELQSGSNGDLFQSPGFKDRSIVLEHVFRGRSIDMDTDL